MFLLLIAFIFLFSCGFTWLVIFPANIEAMGRRITNIGAGFGHQKTHWKNRTRKKVSATQQVISNYFIKISHAIHKHFLLYLIGIAIIGLPPLVALIVVKNKPLEGFDSVVHHENRQIAQLLQGEQLIPPTPLPPAVFATIEVLQTRPMLSDASRNWDLLNAEYKQRLLTAFKIMKEVHGYDMAILEGYRSPERQNLLASMGSNVTNAAAFQSYHQYGLAADCAFYRDGKLVISEKDPWAMRGYQLYGEVAESVGLTWGGRWKMMDFGHTELRVPGGLKRLN